MNDSVKQIIKRDLLIGIVNSATKIRFAIANYKTQPDSQLLDFIDSESRDLGTMAIALRDLRTVDD